jgi:NAD(P)H-hydrate repair Nnr-like enzyme with NAD(P)H-hydrate epimerase domain
MFSIPIHDDAIKVSVPAASANQSDILIDQIIGTEINARPREGAATFLTKMDHFRYTVPQSIPKQMLLHITSVVEKKDTSHNTGDE